MKLTDFREEYKLWKSEGYPGVKDETRRFLENLFDEKREMKFWKHQKESLLKVIYSYEIKGMSNLLLNVVTGGGKTLIIGACIAWLKMCHELDKFLVLVPNIIVKDRIAVDFLPKEKEESIFKKLTIAHQQNTLKFTSQIAEKNYKLTHSFQTYSPNLLTKYALNFRLLLFQRQKSGAKPLIQTSKINIWSEIYNNNSEEWTKDKEQQHTIAAYSNFGQGKVVGLGDIDIFCSDDNIGINSLDNYKFLQNTLIWLTEPVKRPDVMSFILDQMGELQSGVKQIQNTINNIIIMIIGI